MRDLSSKLPRGVRRLFRLSVTRAGMLDNVDDEMRFHFAMRVAELRALGMGEREAAAEARRRFGNVEEYRTHSARHEARQAHRTGRRALMHGIWSDVQYALRALGRTPVFTGAAIAVLALGIGMSTAMAALYTTVFVDRLAVAQQDRIVIAHPLDRRGTHLDVPFSYLPTIAGDTKVFRGIAGVYHLGVQPVPFLDKGVSVELGAVTASANYFHVLGVRPAIGRLFLPDDGLAGAAPVIVLSYRAWQRQFGGDLSVLGRTLVMPYTQQRARVVGVAPAGFAYPTGSDAWIPLPADTASSTLQVDIVARLAPNVSIDAARAQLLALTQRANPFAQALAQQKVTANMFQIAGVDMQSFAYTILGNTRPAAMALLLASALLLLIACVNIGNLVLVRLLGRATEIAVRRAMGATYTDIVRLFGVEQALIALAGGVLGLLTALGLLRIVSVAVPAQLPRMDVVSNVSAPLGAAAAMTLVAILVFGVLPSVIAARAGSYAVLRSDSRAGGETHSRRRARRWLVSTQMALALVMLSGAALLVRTLAHLQSMDLGYTPSHLSVVEFTAPRSDLSTLVKMFDVAQRLVTRIEATPGVIAATPIESEPFKGQSLFIMKLGAAEQPESERSHDAFVPFEFVGPDYFRTFETPILNGRGFTAADTKSSGNVVVINESLARQLWPNQNAVGKQLHTLDDTLWSVVGVVRDTHFRDLKRVGPVAYFDWQQVQPFWNGFVAIRTTNSLAALLPSIRVAAHDVDPNLVLFDARTMDDLLAAPLAQPRLSALLMTGFGVVALLLSAIGLYGVMSSGVRQQTRDIGVRLALGATARDVRRLVLGDALRVVGAGSLIGFVGSIIAGRVLSAQLFGVSPIDPVSLAAAAGLLLTIAAVAAHVPARRATRIDPAVALRNE